LTGRRTQQIHPPTRGPAGAADRNPARNPRPAPPLPGGADEHLPEQHQHQPHTHTRAAPPATGACHVMAGDGLPWGLMSRARALPGAQGKGNCRLPAASGSTALTTTTTTTHHPVAAAGWGQEPPGRTTGRAPEAPEAPNSRGSPLGAGAESPPRTSYFLGSWLRRRVPLAFFSL
jgi:hypothetical protein